jgi:23S rRNA pseudouridine1911/1915/1917 synthase
MDALFPVLHEDDDLLVVNKPAGLVCHPTKDGERSSLIGRIRLHLGHSEGRLVNRLDRETSGIVLVARHEGAARELGRLFARRAAEKRYLAIVHGHPASDETSIVAPLGKDEGSPVAIKDCVRTGGADARTDVHVLRRFTREGGAFSLVEAVPRTGRKHQIRIHLAHVGHPIVGDKIYGGDDRLYLRLVTGTLTPADERRLMLSHHALHARSLSFIWRDRAWAFEAAAGEAFLRFASG